MNEIVEIRQENNYGSGFSIRISQIPLNKYENYAVRTDSETNVDSETRLHKIMDKYAGAWERLARL